MKMSTMYYTPNYYDAMLTSQFLMLKKQIFIIKYIIIEHIPVFLDISPIGRVD